MVRSPTSDFEQLPVSALMEEAAKRNVALTSRQAGLPRDAVVNVSQILTLDRGFLTELVGRLPPRKMLDVDDGLRRLLELTRA